MSRHALTPFIHAAASYRLSHKDDLVDFSPREACPKINHADDIAHEANGYAWRPSLTVKKFRSLDRTPSLKCAA
ncbi:MAG: hypothetical protein WBF43_13975 [Methylocella sp.]